MSLSSDASRQLATLLNRTNTKYSGNLEDGIFLKDKDVIDANKVSLSTDDMGQHVNVVIVDDSDGFSFLALSGDVASSRTNTATNDRETTNICGKPTRYTVSQINTDIHIGFDLLNRWSISDAQDSFGDRLVEFMRARVGADRMIIGWNGQEVSDENTTPGDIKKNGVGWLNQISSQFPDRVLGNASDESIYLGTFHKTEDTFSFCNLDHAVLACVSKIPFSKRKDLVCVVGDGLLEEEKAMTYTRDNFLLEKQKMSFVFDSFAGVPRVSSVGFPPYSLLVTSRENLSIYIKSGSSYRESRSVIKRERLEDYRTAKLAYVVEDPLAFYCMRGIKTDSIVDAVNKGLPEVLVDGALAEADVLART